MIINVPRTELAIGLSTLLICACESQLRAPQVIPIAAPANEPATPASPSDALTEVPDAATNAPSPERQASEGPVPNAVVVAALRPRFRACYNTELQTNPKAAGQVVATVTIAADGRVALAVASKVDGLAESTVKCILYVLRTAEFDPDSGIKTLSVPVTFRQASKRKSGPTPP